MHVYRYCKLHVYFVFWLANQYRIAGKTQLVHGNIQLLIKSTLTWQDSLLSSVKMNSYTISFLIKRAVKMNSYTVSFLARTEKRQSKQSGPVKQEKNNTFVKYFNCIASLQLFLFGIAI